MFHELCNIRQAEQIGGLNLLGDEFNLKHEIVVVKEISHKSNLGATLEYVRHLPPYPSTLRIY